MISRRMFTKTLAGTAATAMVPTPARPQQVFDDITILKGAASWMSEPFNWPDRWNSVKNNDFATVQQVLSSQLFNVYMAGMERLRNNGLDEAMQQYVDNPGSMPGLPDVGYVMECMREANNGWRTGFNTDWLQDSLAGYFAVNAGTESSLPGLINPRGWGDFHGGMATFWLGAWRGKFWNPPLFSELEPKGGHPLLQRAALRRLSRRMRQGLPILPGPDADPSCLLDIFRLDCFPYYPLGYPPYPLQLPPTPTDTNGDPDPWFDLTDSKTPKPRPNETKERICFYAGWTMFYAGWVLRGMTAGGFIGVLVAPEAVAFAAATLTVAGLLSMAICS